MPHHRPAFSSRALVEELFEADLPKHDKPAVPFSVYLRKTPATPLSAASKVLLWLAGALVVLVLVVALARRMRETPAARHRPTDESISALAPEAP
jgi:hypothetical protein